MVMRTIFPGLSSRDEVLLARVTGLADYHQSTNNSECSYFKATVTVQVWLEALASKSKSMVLTFPLLESVYVHHLTYADTHAYSAGSTAYTSTRTSGV